MESAVHAWSLHQLEIYDIRVQFGWSRYFFDASGSISGYYID